MILFFFLLNFIDQSNAQGNSRLRETFKTLTVIENPFELRDPFKAPLSRSSVDGGREAKSLIRDGVYTNIEQAQITDIKSLRIVGVMIGRERRALAKIVGGKGDVIILREGMRLGSDNAELKAIHPGGVILVEKLVNVYGEEEFLETVIPISQ